MSEIENKTKMENPYLGHLLAWLWAGPPCPCRSPPTFASRQRRGAAHRRRARGGLHLLLRRGGLPFEPVRVWSATQPPGTPRPRFPSLSRSLTHARTRSSPPPVVAATTGHPTPH